MPIKINGVDGRPAPIGAGQPVQRAREMNGREDRKPAEGADGVRITGTASQMAALEQALREQPAVDEARVAEVRSALEQGRYTIRPDRIADQLLELERALEKLGHGE